MKKSFLLGIITLVMSVFLVACEGKNATEITNTESKTEIEVDVEEKEEFVPPFTLGRTYYKAEQLTQLTPIKITNDPGNIVWTSENPNVAQVVNGRVLYLTEGETVISADTEKYHKEINVSVSSSVLYSTPIESVTVKTHDKYILLIDDDVNIPNGFEDKISELMTLVEKRTGLSYVRNDKEEFFQLEDPEMIEVVITDKISTSCASSQFVFLKSDHLIVDEENGNSEEKMYATILENLIYCIQLRNSVGLGNALSGGYAIVNAYKIVEEDLGYSGAFDRYLSEKVEYLKVFNRLTSENVYAMLIDQPIDSHAYSFFFVKYLYETYGDTIMDKLIQNTNKLFYERSPEHYGGGSGGVLTSEDFLNIIISETSETILSDYVSWMKANQYD